MRWMSNCSADANFTIFVGSSCLHDSDLSGRYTVQCRDRETFDIRSFAGVCDENEIFVDHSGRGGRFTAVCLGMGSGNEMLQVPVQPAVKSLRVQYRDTALTNSHTLGYRLVITNYNCGAVRSASGGDVYKISLLPTDMYGNILATKSVLLRNSLTVPKLPVGTAYIDTQIRFKAVGTFICHSYDLN